MQKSPCMGVIPHMGGVAPQRLDSGSADCEKVA